MTSREIPIEAMRSAIRSEQRAQESVNLDNLVSVEQAAAELRALVEERWPGKLPAVKY